MAKKRIIDILGFYNGYIFKDCGSSSEYVLAYDTVIDGKVKNFFTRLREPITSIEVDDRYVDMPIGGGQKFEFVQKIRCEEKDVRHYKMDTFLQTLCRILAYKIRPTSDVYVWITEEDGLKSFHGACFYQYGEF